MSLPVRTGSDVIVLPVTWGYFAQIPDHPSGASTAITPLPVPANVSLPLQKNVDPGGKRLEAEGGKNMAAAAETAKGEKGSGKTAYPDDDWLERADDITPRRTVGAVRT
ncbi:UNVERIFIED_CONTAM: hypothetical protein K2H54_068351 [Gekko kuhli]